MVLKCMSHYCVSANRLRGLQLLVSDIDVGTGQKVGGGACINYS